MVIKIKITSGGVQVCYLSIASIETVKKYGVAHVEYSPKLFHCEMVLSGHCSCSTGPCVSEWMGQLQNFLMGIYGILCGSTETSPGEIFRNQLGTGHVAYLLCESRKIQNEKSSIAIGTLHHLILGDRTQKHLLSLNLKIERLRNRRGK